MEFYKSISEHYDYIFPTSPQQLSFVKDRFSDPHESTILDVGCGTANLCISMAPHFNKVIGIDPDLSMLQKAEEKADKTYSNLSFYPYGMLDIETQFKDLDGVLCLGNTLVHLNSDKEILEFLRQALKALRPGGKLLIQIINYDRIIDQDIRALPTLENDQIKFVRNYRYVTNKNILEFETQLTIKASDKVLRNLIQLYPIRRSELGNLLKNAGFGDVTFFGNFKGEALTDESIPLVLEAIS